MAGLVRGERVDRMLEREARDQSPVGAWPGRSWSFAREKKRRGEDRGGRRRVKKVGERSGEQRTRG